MACNASKAPFLRAIAKRGYSANVCPRPAGQGVEVQTKVLDNKILVATAESTLPVSRVSIVLRAGSRNESYDIRGAAHLLRISASLSTENFTGFAITRNIQQVGGTLSCSVDRELVKYTVTTTSNNIETGLRYLQDIVQPAFKPWELADNAALLKNQIAAVSPQTRAVELLHKAAFRSGLGNSVYIPKEQIGKVSSESLQHYVACNFTSGRASVVGVGVDNNALAGFAQTLSLPTGSSKVEAANYYGGDVRKDTAGHIAHVAVAGLGGSANNLKEALAFAILECALGAGAVTKRGNANGAFGKAFGCAIGDGRGSFKTLNATYADAGLFGFVVSADAQVVCKLLDGLTGVLKSGSVSAEDVKRGKAILKANIQQIFASDSTLIEEMATQAGLTKQVIGVDTLSAAIDGITQQQVQEAAKKVGSSKLSIGAVGNLENVPYSSDLA